jgi:cyanate permease
MIIGGIAKAIGQLLRIRAFGMGHGAVTYVACQSAMVISFLFAVFVWDEPLTAVRAAGIVLILAMFVLISKLEKPAHASPMDSRRWLIITILSLSLIGVCQILYMTPSHWDGWTDPGGLRIPLVTLAGSFGALGMAYYKKQTFNRTVVFTAIGIGLCMFINLRLILLALDLLTPLKASGLVHPMATGAAVVFFTLYSRFILRELFRLRHWLGLSIGVVGLTLMGL